MLLLLTDLCVIHLNWSNSSVNEMVNIRSGREPFFKFNQIVAINEKIFRIFW